MIEGLLLTPLKIISNPKGDILHAMKVSSPGFGGFGEAYFSSVLSEDVKGWKKHNKMVLNLVVPIGAIKFVLYDSRAASPTNGQFFEVVLSPENYQRLTVPVGIWMGFQGMGKQQNLLLNMASIEHDPEEADNLPLDAFPYDWGTQRMRILVTGGTGFLGGRLVAYLRAIPGFEVLAGSRSPGMGRTLMEFNNPSQLEDICTGVDTIVHLAGLNAGQCAQAGEAELLQDVTATKNLKEAAFQRGVKQFLHLSSAHVYGAMEGKIDESSATLNTHPYALNHLSKEAQVKDALCAGYFKGHIIRLSNAFGYPVDTRANCWMLLVNDLCRQGAQTGVLNLNSNGEQRRDFVTISRFCEVILFLLNNPKLIPHYVLNVGVNLSATVNEMAKLIAEQFNKVTGHLPPVHRAKPLSGNPAVEFDFSIQRLLGFGYNDTAEINVDQELRKTIELCLKYFQARQVKYLIYINGFS